MKTRATQLERLEGRCLFSALALDSSFASDGLYVNNFQQLGSQPAGSFVQPDGKILVTGSATVNGAPGEGTNNDGVLLRLNADGSLDTSFADNGVSLDPNGAGAVVTVAGNGDIYVAGTEWLPGAQPAIRRYSPDGTLDTTFGNQGTAVANFAQPAGSYGGYFAFSAIIVQPDGKIVGVGELRIVADADEGDIGVARFNSDGSADASFGNNGIVTLNYRDTTAKGYQNSAASLSIDSGGKIVVGGSVVNYINESTNTGSFVVARLNTDGSPDTSFGDQGHVLTSFHTDTDPTDWITFDRATISSVFAESDGKILAIGAGAQNQILAARYNADGSLDTTFAGDGMMIAAGTGSRSDAAEELPDGGFVVAGGAFADPTQPVAWAKFDQNGTLVDSASSSADIALTESDAAAAFAADGSIIVAGSNASSSLEVTKFNVTADPVEAPPVVGLVTAPPATDPSVWTINDINDHVAPVTSTGAIFVNEPAAGIITQSQGQPLSDAATFVPVPVRFVGANLAAAGKVYRFQVTYHSTTSAAITPGNVPVALIQSPTTTEGNPGFTATATVVSSHASHKGQTLTVNYTVVMPTDVSANGFHTIFVGEMSGAVFGGTSFHTFLGHGGVNPNSPPAATVVHAVGPSKSKAGAPLRLMITYQSTTGKPITAADVPNTYGYAYADPNAVVSTSGTDGTNPQASKNGLRLTLTYLIPMSQSGGLQIIEVNGKVIHSFTASGGN